jgi:hypothetical protein
MKNAVLKYTVSRDGWHSVNGWVYCLEGRELVPVGHGGSNAMHAQNVFDYYSEDNGFECQKVKIVEV